MKNFSGLMPLLNLASFVCLFLVYPAVLLWLFYTFCGSYTVRDLFTHYVALLQDFIVAEIRFFNVFETGSVFLAFLGGHLFLAARLKFCVN